MAMPEKPTEERPTVQEETTEMAEETTERTEESVLDFSSIGAVISPEGVIMLPIAVIIDVLDFLIGSLFILDIVAILTIGVWIYFHSQQLAVTKGAAARLSKWARRLRWLRPVMIILEFIPIVGMLPLWTLLVYFELKQ
jgi:hypothetical protein